MSRTSITERNKAIRKAWEKEQQLVKEGKGTRDWTKEQQQDILDPNKGKAYDEQGRALEGQHMKSATEYPEYQGDPNNIQFLTRDEHLEAHKGNWNNPSNWYYDPVTKEFYDFGDGEPIPCRVIELSDPIVAIESLGKSNESTIEDKITKERKKKQSVSSTVDEQIPNNKTKRGNKSTKISSNTLKASILMKPKVENRFVKGLKSIGRFIVNHPEESMVVAGKIIGGGIELVSAVAGRQNKVGDTSTSGSNGNGMASIPKTGIVAGVADIVAKASRAENDVCAHAQRYHLKDGSVILKNKAPYHRGGKR